MAAGDHRIEGSLEMSEKQRRARRWRSIAIGLALAAFVIIVYVGTFAKMGAAILNRPL